MARNNSANDALLPDHPAVNIPVKILARTIPSLVFGMVLSVVAIAVFGTIAYLPAVLKQLFAVVLAPEVATSAGVLVGWGGAVVVLVALMALE